MLTPEQKDVARRIVAGLDDHPYQTLGGLAGVGKTLLMSAVLQALPGFVACAYTGKAVNVLRKKGVANARTIHSLIYHPSKDEDGNTVWYRASKSDLMDVAGFFVDEGSMVSREIHEDILFYGKPVVYFGDHGQLEPVGGTQFNLMAEPMYRLETVHRNAGEIAHFAQHLRRGEPARTFACERQVQVVRESAVTPRHMSTTDQVICAYNRSRVKINNLVREERNVQYAYIAVGDKVMCLRNNRQEGLFNGMQGVVTKVRKNEHFDFVSDDTKYSYVHYDPDQFGKESNEFEFSQRANPFDYAYAITAHKSQGDQWNNVLVFEQRCAKWDHCRWAYTAASRARKGLVWVEAAGRSPLLG